LATTYSVGLQFTAKTQQLDAVFNKINKLERDLGRLKGSDPFQGVEDSAKGAGQAIDNTGKKAKAAAGGFSALAGAVGKLGLAYAALGAAKFVFAKTAELETQTRSIQVLVGSLDKAKNIVSELQQYANVTPFTSSEIIDTAKRLSAFGVSAEKVVDTTKRLGDVAGATGANLGELSLAYGQVMAKGRLQGEELLQFQERGVALQDELRKMYGLTGEQFSDALSKGKISAQAVEVALKRLTDIGGKYANGAISQSDTLNGKLSTLQDAIGELARQIGSALSPALVKVLTDITNMANGFVSSLQWMKSEYNNFLSDLRGKDAGALQGQIDDINRLITAKQAQLKNAPPAAEQIIQDRIKELRALRTGLQKDLDQKLGLVAPKGQSALLPSSGASAQTPPPLLGGSGGSKAGKGASASSFQPSSRAKALIAAASKLGVSPLDLATIISFETGGTFSPSIMGGAGGNYMGLIQFGPNERRQYGAHSGQSFEEQVQGPVVRYFQDRFKNVGMSTQGADLLTLYRTVLGGNPKANINARDAFGTSAASGVGAMGPHRNKALAMFFGGDMANVGYDAADAAENLAAGWDEIHERIQGSFEEGQKLTTELQRQLDSLNAVDDAAREQLRIQFEWKDRQDKINELLDEKQKKDLAALNNKIKEIEQLKLQTEELEKQQKIIDDMQGGGYKNFSGGNINTYTDAGAAIAESDQRLKDLLNPVNQVAAAGAAIGEAFGESFKGIINGSMSAQEALANFFQKTADHFIDMAAQIAAAAIQNGILKMIFGAATGAITGGAFGGGGIDWGQTPSVGGVPDLPGLTPFADGGFVTGPTRAIVGEGGANEYVIPENKMGGAMARWNAGARGDSVISGADPTGHSGGGTALAEAPPQVNITGGILNFNDSHYIRADQVPSIISQSAKQGEARALRKLQQSPGARRKLGMA
jgi:tape measure domain-containing protein